MRQERGEAGAGLVLALIHPSKQAHLFHFLSQDIGDYSQQLLEELFRVVLSPLETIAFVLLQ